MSKEKSGDLKKELLEINKFIAKLDPLIRLKAFELLIEDTDANTTKSEGDTVKKGSKAKAIPASSFEEFLKKSEHKTPADALELIVAWLYSQHGTIAITTQMVRTLSNSSGLTIPTRPDATMRVATDKGKKLYARDPKGYKLTVSGELYLKEKYSVSKGSKPVPIEEKA